MRSLTSRVILGVASRSDAKTGNPGDWTQPKAFHRAARDAWIPGSRCARPGMTRLVVALP